MTNSRDASLSFGAPTIVAPTIVAPADMSARELRTRYRLGGPGTTTLHLSARDFADLQLDPNSATVEFFGATFTRLETI